MPKQGVQRLSVRSTAPEPTSRMAGTGRRLVPALVRSASMCRFKVFKFQPAGVPWNFWDRGVHWNPNPARTTGASGLVNPKRGDLISDFHYPTAPVKAPITNVARTPGRTLAVPPSSPEAHSVDLWGLRRRRPHQRRTKPI